MGKYLSFKIHQTFSFANPFSAITGSFLIYGINRVITVKYSKMLPDKAFAAAEKDGTVTVLYDMLSDNLEVNLLPYLQCNFRPVSSGNMRSRFRSQCVCVFLHNK